MRTKQKRQVRLSGVSKNKWENCFMILEANNLIFAFEKDNPESFFGHFSAIENPCKLGANGVIVCPNYFAKTYRHQQNLSKNKRSLQH
jgi:hypothetical protein